MAGYIPRLQHPISESLPKLHHPPLMVPRSSCESLVSLRSIIHPIASSTESESDTTTLSLNMRESPRYTWDRHTRASVESFVSQHDTPYPQNGPIGYGHVRKANEPTAHKRYPSSFTAGSKFPDSTNPRNQQPYYSSTVGQSHPKSVSRFSCF